MTTADLLASQTFPAKARALQIALAVWPNIGERPTWQQAELQRDVQEVLDGRAAPCVSRTERDAIKAEAKRLSELGS
jgi:hypothetical protein